jgi:hypothetical protein
MKEAGRAYAQIADASLDVVAEPPHLVRPFLPPGARFVWPADHVVPGTPYYVVTYARFGYRPPEDCTVVNEVRRRPLLSWQPLVLAYVARCRSSARH